MFCSNCGHPLEEGAKFCPNCGTPVTANEAPVTEPTPPQPEAPAQEPVLVVEPSPAAEPAGEPNLTLDGSDAPKAPEPPVVNTTPPTPPPAYNGSDGTPPSGNGPSQDTLILILRAVCGTLGVVFAYFALRHSLYLIQFIFNYIGYLGEVFLGYYPRGLFGWLVMFLLYLIRNAVQIAPPLVAAATLLPVAIKWDEKHNDLVFGGMVAATALRIIHLVLSVLVSVVIGLLIPYAGILGGAYIGKSFLYILGYAVAAGVIFAAMYLVGCPPVIGEDLEQVKANILASIRELTSRIQRAADDVSQKAAAKSSETAHAASPTAAVASTGSPQFKKTNRSLLTYILLNIITCGIYSWFFVHNLSKDANDVCAGDGQKTGGLLAFLLLGMITCGIYQLIWWYKLCNRMASNAPRYGLVFQENGTTYLMWQLFGVLLCGIGPFIALHIAIKNMNALCAAYNQRNGFYTTPNA